MKYSFYRQDMGPAICYMLDIFRNDNDGDAVTLMVHKARVREDAVALKRFNSLKNKIENGEIDEINKHQENVISDYEFRLREEETTEEEITDDERFTF